MEEAPWDWRGGDHTASPLLAALLARAPVGPTHGQDASRSHHDKEPTAAMGRGREALYNRKQNLFPLAIQKPKGPVVLTSVR